jgi:DNA-binding NtrC family response regulator
LAKVGILVIDDNAASQSALRQMLDSDEWQVRVVSVLHDALPELSTGAWSLVIADVGMIGLTSPLFLILRELAIAPAIEGTNVRARVLFLVPQDAPREARVVLEKDRLPYISRPFEFNDVLEKVSDLLMETGSLADPIRRVRREANATERKRNEGRVAHEANTRLSGRDTGMFANRAGYDMTDEEITEYENMEKEEQEKKKKKLPQNR